MVAKFSGFSNGDFIVPVKNPSMVIILRDNESFNLHYVVRLSGKLQSKVEITENDFPPNYAKDVEFRYATPFEVHRALQILLENGLYWDFARRLAIPVDDLRKLFFWSKT